MSPPDVHPWDLTPREARELQTRLAAKVELSDRMTGVRRLAGVDCGFPRGGKLTRAAIAVFSWPALEPLDESIAEIPTAFPYVPGLLSFRELPAVLTAFEALGEKPDLLLCDGQGVAHPRRLGVASHLGVLLDLPAVGVAKSRLTGSYRDPGPNKGDRTALMDGRDRIGTVLRTRDSVKPVFVSPGHRCSIEGAERWVLACTTRFRLPEPIRAADRLASRRS